ncbi:MAG: PspC domain-containing protein [Caldithrix sp.]|nr:PspC domain-containing protein [Caldithrix sp.]
MKPIYRSTKNKRLAGICGGLGEIFQLDPVLIRLLFIFIAVTTGIFPLVLTYIVGWFIIPADDEL